MIADTPVRTSYLRQRFGVEGVAQLSNQLKSEKLAYWYMLQKFRENGNSEMVRTPEAAPVTMAGGTPEAYRALRDPAFAALGLARHTIWI